jgi:hypothetical protein
MHKLAKNACNNPKIGTYMQLTGLQLNIQSEFVYFQYFCRQLAFFVQNMAKIGDFSLILAIFG